ncbi:putative cullin [Podospora fimiseda]|uniref:Cullin n=1 Tax=Podospora fimiseda TaxID=252190 RepID=A0AAN7GRW8_9PEZI|nr:putative cullin [Podospora fimiseda]
MPSQQPRSSILSTAGGPSISSSSSPKRRDLSPSPSSDPKRVRSEYTFSSSTMAMSAKMQGKRPVGAPDIIDLTGSSSFHTTMSINNNIALHPHLGPKRLVVKNLKPVRSSGVDNYYSRTTAELDNALTAIFQGRPTAQPMVSLYRGVEDLCTRGKAEAQELADRVRQRLEKWLQSDDMMGMLIAEASAGGVREGGEEEVRFLTRVIDKWKQWSEKILTVRQVFSYLDRSYLLAHRPGTKDQHGQKLEGLNDMGITLFRRVIFGRGKGDASAPVGNAVLRGVCRLITMGRENMEFDSGLLRDAIAVLKLFQGYTRFFEPRFLQESHQYFEEYARLWASSLKLSDYIRGVKRLLDREEHNCNFYNHDSTTKRQLLEDARRVLIKNYSEKLLHSGDVANLLDQNDVDSIGGLYQLLTLSDLQKELKGPWEEYIRTTGTAIVTDKTRGDDMVKRLLLLRRALDVMIRDALHQDEVFVYALRESFGQFINDKKATSAWNTGTSKVGEMIAKHIDMLLRGGLKTLPPSLLSDVKDRANAEASGLAATADEDAELDRQLDAALELFRFIEGKDIFEAFYKKDLARRLLLGRSASQDAERSMISKLKSECGSNFTHNLEQMFKDMSLARDEMVSYKEWLQATNRKTGRIDLSVTVLSQGAWPNFPEANISLPKEVWEQHSVFELYYKTKHTGRLLTWKHNQAHAIIRARFNKETKELLVSASQAAVLMLFNTAENGILTYAQILYSTQLPGPEIDRTLQSLACGKVKVLTKHPKGKEIKETDTFSVNGAFTDQRFRIKINTIQLKETKEENQQTHVKVASDRQFETQAAIVRIMKSRKVLGHAQLVAEVINQTKARGAVDPADIKANIEKLIEKDYLDREDGNYVYQA